MYIVYVWEYWGGQKTAPDTLALALHAELGSLQEQMELFTAEPPLQPLKISFVSGGGGTHL